jgi:hypothetical protein
MTYTTPWRTWKKMLKTRTMVSRMVKMRDNTNINTAIMENLGSEIDGPRAY